MRRHILLEASGLEQWLLDRHGSVVPHKGDENLLLVRLPLTASAGALSKALKKYGVAEVMPGKTGGHYRLAFIARKSWPGPAVGKRWPKKGKSKKGVPLFTKHEKGAERRGVIHGASVVFEKGVSEKLEKVAVGKLRHAREMLRALRFGEAWGGNIIVSSKLSGVSGSYRRQSDTMRLNFPVKLGTIIHEFGHRWWYRNMTRPRRLQFIAWVKAGLSPVSAYGGKDPWEAFAEAFRYFVQGKKMTSQQVETFKLIARGGRFESVESVRECLLGTE